MNIIIPKQIEIAMGSANTFVTSTANNGARLVRVTNPTAGVVLITVASNSSVNTATVTMLGNSSVVIQKNQTDTLVANNAAVVGGVIGFSH